MLLLLKFAVATVLQEMAVLDFVSTDIESRGSGHCGALLGGLEHMLGPGLGVKSLVAVMDPQVGFRAWASPSGRVDGAVAGP